MQQVGPGIMQCGIGQAILDAHLLGGEAEARAGDAQSVSDPRQDLVGGHPLAALADLPHACLGQPGQRCQSGPGEAARPQEPQHGGDIALGEMLRDQHAVEGGRLPPAWIDIHNLWRPHPD